MSQTFNQTGLCSCSNFHWKVKEGSCCIREFRWNSHVDLFTTSNNLCHIIVRAMPSWHVDQICGFCSESVRHHGCRHFNNHLWIPHHAPCSWLVVWIGRVAISISMTNATKIHQKTFSLSMLFRFSGYLLHIYSPIIARYGSCCSDGSYKFPAKICQGSPCTFFARCIIIRFLATDLLQQTMTLKPINETHFLPFYHR